MNLEDMMMLSAVSQSQKNNYCVIPLYEVCDIDPQKQGVERWVPSTGKRGMQGVAIGWV